MTAIASVYIETSIPSYYFETRSTPEAITWRRATRHWWEEYRPFFDLVTSDVTLEELSRAPSAKADPGRELLAGLPLAARSDAVVRVAAYYIEHRLVPRAAIADAMHIALASHHGIDHLLTWNIQHLANPNKTKHLAVLNRRLRLSTPTLVTPLTLLPEITP
jgi:predicted nucleic acid-binding protein